MDHVPLISYAQNNEDIMLWRVFRDSGAGFYVDVGANSPEEDSVTKLFYERGWRGINIEPLDPWISQLASSRPEDINLAVCTSDQHGEVELLNVAETGLSTSNLSMKARYAKDFEVTTVTRPTRTLTSILEKHAKDPIHFMKIDVEGMEHSTLAGCDFSKFRPIVILVESIEPQTFEPNHHEWEPLLVEHGYDFLYFDGLNRFYSAKEHTSTIRPHFQTPPNLFDGYSRKINFDMSVALNESLHEIELRDQEIESKNQEIEVQNQELNLVKLELKELEDQLDASMSERAVLEQDLISTELQVVELHRSTSWKLTAPMRWIKDISKRAEKIRNR